MSWTLGNKRWTVPFVSKGGISCRVDIYQRGYTGSNVTTLASNVANATACAAANPFYFEEDDDEDLTTVIRTKTGYLRLVELEEDGVLDLHPATNVDHMVELYYNGELTFCGFMMAENFQTEWTVTPREVEFPVMSMLGLLDDYHFAAINPPAWKTLGELFSEILSGADNMYTNIVFPSIGESGNVGFEFDNYEMLSLVVSPPNKKANTSTASDYYEPNSYLYLIEGICNAFGLVAHDDRKTLVFTKFDYTGNYFMFNGSTSSNYVTPSVVDLDELLDVRGTDNEQTTILPMSKVTVQYGGQETTSADIDMKDYHNRVGTIAMSGWEMVRCKPIDGELTFDHEVSDSMQVNAEGKMSENGVAAMAVGEDSLTEYIMFQSLSETWPADANLFKWTVYDWPNRGFTLKFKVDMGTIGSWDTSGALLLYVRISCGSKKWNNTSQQWDSTGSSITVNVIDLTQEYSISVGADPEEYAPLEIEFALDTYFTTFVYGISGLRLEAYSSSTNDYVNVPISLERKIMGSPSPEEADVDSEFKLYSYLETNYLDKCIVKTVAGGLIPEPAYQYLINPQNRLRVDGEITLPYAYYCKKYQFWKAAWRWRIIATAFQPWDDLWTLTLHRSTVNE